MILAFLIINLSTNKMNYGASQQRRALYIAEQCCAFGD